MITCLDRTNKQLPYAIELADISNALVPVPGNKDIGYKFPAGTITGIALVKTGAGEVTLMSII